LIEVGAITAISQAVTRLFRFSRVARLQVSVSRYAKLHAQLRAQEGLTQPADKIAGLIDCQISDLVTREEAALSRVYDWNTFAGAVVFSAIIGSPMYWLITYRSWWTTTLAIIDGLFIVLFIAIGISSIRKNPKQLEQDAIGPPEEQISGPRKVTSE
jgi:hypothetical protein